MKARIKKTGEIVEVFKNKHNVYIDEEHRGHSAESLDFMFDEETHWQDIRERAAIAVLGGLMADSVFGDTPLDTAKIAIDYADALVEQLKKK